MANRIKELRKQKGYTLNDVANNLKVTPMTISRYENGKREPKLETWQKLANFFGVSVPYLQGCDYCDFGSNNRATLVARGRDEFTFVYVGNDKAIHIRNNRKLNIATDQTINYCPMCGRKLSQK
ncbi:transcriptional regulator with XRE-family HTH domain [Lactobacillus colini]|uniref:Transcriptional regulator with XRE-family HTH domain n=1 Tax=Lactobacillus colini TaxID=1819254 RepID=A0ABS4MG01_9LACO|nr:helix-turn-helix transcriptional regulator [Lactobacillus colini]MBP2058616.1 transcriptional regulator with XRE-family HTH domain [Lactobacillus colini]